MKLSNLGLALAACISIFTGTAFQQNPKAQSLPSRLFSQAKAEDFIGDEACGACHEETVKKFPKSGHAAFMHQTGAKFDKTGCEACHGPGAIHTREENPENISFAKVSPKEASEACLRCHGDLLKAGHWKNEAHSRGKLSCVSCHQIHPQDEAAKLKDDKGLIHSAIFPAAKESSKLLKADEATLCGQCHKPEVMQFRGSSHHPVPEGKLVCSDCHQAHPRRNEQKRQHDVKQNCVTCHTEMAGPFAFEHDPVAGHMGNGCNECHKPHGSHNPSLLKGFSRGLCSQCHTDKNNGHFPGRTCWTSGCHVAVHGSNSDHRLLSK